MDGNVKSSSGAKKLLLKMSEINVSVPVVRELTTMIGNELQLELWEQAGLHTAGELEPEKPESPQVVSVAVDGGRIMTRGHSGRGVHDPQWKETKNACLLSLSSEWVDHDPHPNLPVCFSNRSHVEKLVKEIHSRGTVEEQQNAAISGVSEDEASLLQLPEEATIALRKRKKKSDWRPKKLVRTCVGSMACSRDFGALVAAEAQRRGFYNASRKAFLGDGQRSNWTIHEERFPDFIAVLDFVHPLGYIYKASQAMSAENAWRFYVEAATACWQGKVGDVVTKMRRWLETQPTGDENQADNSPRVVVSKCITYLENNQSRMDYPTYRQLGLPMSTSSIESLIKEVNFRVKGTEKFWNRPDGADAILSVRHAALSDDDRLSAWILSRPGSVYYRPRNPRPPTLAL